MPQHGEAGGIPSNTKAYYSFTHGNIHFIVLNSYDVNRYVPTSGCDPPCTRSPPSAPQSREHTHAIVMAMAHARNVVSATCRSPSGAMLTWAKADAAAAAASPDIDWLIGVFHHAPYSRGLHDSDVEAEMVQMRTYALPILEAAGVDVVYSGHSHSYERSHLIDAAYGLSTAYQACHSLVSGGSTFTKPAGVVAHAGTVYLTAGSSGRLEAMSPRGPHPVMAVTTATMGSVVFDVTPTMLTGRFVTIHGSVGDEWSITKSAGYTPPSPTC